MKKILYLALVAVAVLFASCKEEHTTPVNAVAKSLFAPGGDGSLWEYHNGRAQSGQDADFTVRVEKYTEYTNLCDERKVYSEAITYDLGGKSCAIYSNSCTIDGTASIEYAIPGSDTKLYLECDAEGNYNCKNHEVIGTMAINGVDYENVHLFDVEMGTDLYHCYFAEGLGLIYLYDENQKIQLKVTCRPTIR